VGLEGAWIVQLADGERLLLELSILYRQGRQRATAPCRCHLQCVCAQQGRDHNPQKLGGKGLGHTSWLCVRPLWGALLL